MHSAARERLEFAPPPVKGSLRALALALIVHLLLIAALTWGVHWKHSEEAASFEAELWSASAQQAAPRPTPPQAVAEPENRPEPTPPTPTPTPTPVPVPRPAPVPPPPPVKAPQAKPAPPAHEADIALEKEKEKKRQQLAQKAAEQEQAKKLQEKQQAEQALALLRKAAEKAAQAEKAAEQKLQAKALEKEKRATAATDEKRHQKAVDDILRAASSGLGSAPKGPSAGYASKVVARVLPNVVFSDEITGSPKAEVEVRSTADGTIMSQRLVKSSGNKAWDDAVIKALIRTGSLPRDVDGRVPTPMIIVFQPRN